MFIFETFRVYFSLLSDVTLGMILSFSQHKYEVISKKLWHFIWQFGNVEIKKYHWSILNVLLFSSKNKRWLNNEYGKAAEYELKVYKLAPEANL